MSGVPPGVSWRPGQALYVPQGLSQSPAISVAESTSSGGACLPRACVPASLRPGGWRAAGRVGPHHCGHSERALYVGAQISLCSYLSFLEFLSLSLCLCGCVCLFLTSVSLSSRCLSLVCVSLCLHLCLSPPRGPPRPLRLGLCPSPPCPFLCLSPCHRPLPRGFPSHCSRKEGLTDGQFWERPRGLHFSLSWPLPALTLGAFHTRRPDGASKGTRGLLHRPCSTPRRLQEPVLSPTPGRGSRGPPPRAALPPGRHPCPLPL